MKSNICIRTKCLAFIICLLSFTKIIAQDPACNNATEVINQNFSKYAASNKEYTLSDLSTDFPNVSARTSGEIRGINGGGQNWPQTTKVINGELRAEFLKNAAGGPKTGFLFDSSFGDTEEATLEYRVKFDKNFVWALGGKLPGLGGSTNTGGGAIPSGCTKNTSHINNGFSCRLMWRTTTVNKNNAKLVVYTYFPDRNVNKCGVDIKMMSGLQKDKWYTIKQYIKLNTPGQKNGTLIMEVDGATVVNRTDIAFRNKPEVKINALVMNTYRGGSASDSRWWSPTTDYIYFDDIKVTANCPLAVTGTPTVEETREEARNAHSNSLGTDVADQDAEDQKQPYDGPDIPDVPDEDVPEVNIGAVPERRGESVTASPGTAGPRASVASGSWKYEKHNLAVPNTPIQKPASYINTINSALNTASDAATAADGAITGIPYFDGIGWGIREFEKNALDSYRKANRNSLAQYGAVAVTTETQFHGRGALNLNPLIFNFGIYNTACDNYFFTGKKTKCRNKVAYLESAINTINQVIASYNHSPSDMNTGIAEQIREKYLGIINKIYQELELTRLQAEKTSLLKKLRNP